LARSPRAAAAARGFLFAHGFTLEVAQRPVRHVLENRDGVNLVTPRGSGLMRRSAKLEEKATSGVAN